MESTYLLSTLDLHHPPLFLSLFHDLHSKSIHSTPALHYCLRKADFDRLNFLLSTSSVLSTLNSHKPNVEDGVELFYNELYNAVSQSVPLLPTKNHSSSPPWYTEEHRSLRIKRNKLWHSYLTSRSDSVLASYQAISSLFTERFGVLYNDYLVRMESTLLSEPRKFFDFINIKRKSNGFPPILKLGESSSSDPVSIANMFADFFKLSFCDHVPDPDISYFSYLRTCPQISHITVDIDPSLVVLKINVLPDEYVPGPDGIQAIALKKCAAHLIPPLTQLFRLSLSQGLFPSFWKHSFITAIHKNCCKNSISNYRPIAKLSCIPKLFESLVYDSMFFHCKSIISPAQHGFFKSRSTTTNLVTFVSRALQAMEDRYEVDAIAINFSKAFDKIYHKIILLKLNALGFHPLFISWISSYLQGRQYRVRFDSTLSSPCPPGQSLRSADFHIVHK